MAFPLKTTAKNKPTGKAPAADRAWTQAVSTFRNAVMASDLLLEDENDNVDYPALELFLLETVLNLLGFNSHRAKSRFLGELRAQGDLIGFYRLLRLDGFWFQHGLVPCYSTWTQYKVRLNPHSVFRSEHALAPLTQAVLAFDGKEVRSTAGARAGLQRASADADPEPEPRVKPMRGNARMINVVSDHRCLMSIPVDNENRWISRHFIDLALNLSQNHPGRPITGDKAYCRSQILRAFRSHNIPFVLPLNNTLNTRLRRSIDSILNRTSLREDRFRWLDKVSAGRVLQTEVRARRNPHIDSNRLAPWLIEIKRLDESGRLLDRTVLLSNVEPAPGQNPAEMFFTLRRLHWQVETYHKRLDVWHRQDDFHKCRRTANLTAFQHALIDSLCSDRGIRSKNELMVLRGLLLVRMKAAMAFCGLILSGLFRPKAELAFV